MRTQPSLLTLVIAIGLPLHAAPPERGFISKQPARNWEQALITGNGKQGAMVYGIPNEETVVLNHGRLYLPLHPPLPPPDTGPLLPEIRRRMAAGEFQQAADLVVATADQAGYGGKRWTDPFIPACDLRISLPPAGDPTAYQRSVDFTTGIASTEWADTRGRFSRRVFVSRADDVIAMSLTGPGKGTVDCQLRLATRPAAGQGAWDSERMFKDGIKGTTAPPTHGWRTYPPPPPALPAPRTGAPAVATWRSPRARPRARAGGMRNACSRTASRTPPPPPPMAG